MDILLGLHDELFAKMTERTLQRFGHQTKLVKTLGEMLEEANASNGVPFFDLYLMDANLGKYGANCCESAKQVYSLLKKSLESDQASFLAVSGGHAYDRAIEAGIPALMKGSREYNDFLRSLRDR